MIDRDALEREAGYDGKYVLRTNTALAPADAAQAYKGLWQEVGVKLKFNRTTTPTFDIEHRDIVQSYRRGPQG